ncbi:MAG: precorrin-8X methylmutase [Actinomycetota bacterium]|nr:precorrin-8X methylmutase [Actinomycetota bacterium]
MTHPIETESYRILESRVDLTHLPPLSRAVVARIIHASADLDYAATTVLDEHALGRGVRALRRGAPVVTDVHMVGAGITGVGWECFLTTARAEDGLTRSAAAMRLAVERHPSGAIFVIGCAPTALFELLRLDADPALVIGLPVGFVGAADSKRALRQSGLPAVSNVGEKGGSAVASAALNALVRVASTEERR